mmetsp:Transcript_24256/g.60766  ORF Transcript_24256/g.60766 Transcript_24256/m.60766 type:complete len:94 (+) Transcript_24256:649-930(+)
MWSNGLELSACDRITQSRPSSETSTIAFVFLLSVLFLLLWILLSYERLSRALPLPMFLSVRSCGVIFVYLCVSLLWIWWTVVGQVNGKFLMTS